MTARSFEDALGHMLSAWDQSRDHALADLIDEVTLALHPKLAPIPSTHAEWLVREAEGNSADVLLLLERSLISRNF